MTPEELDGVDRVLSGLEGELGKRVANLLTAEEIAALVARRARLRLTGLFPAPSGQMSPVPWPFVLGALRRRR